MPHNKDDLFHNRLSWGASNIFSEFYQEMESNSMDGHGQVQALSRLAIKEFTKDCIIEKAARTPLWVIALEIVIRICQYILEVFYDENKRPGDGMGNTDKERTDGMEETINARPNKTSTGNTKGS